MQKACKLRCLWAFLLDDSCLLDLKKVAKKVAFTIYVIKQNNKGLILPNI